MSVMQMLFDQDYIWDVHVKNEVRQAREEERDNGILITIVSLREFGHSEADIIQKIMVKYKLDPNTAKKYMAMAVNDVTK